MVRLSVVRLSDREPEEKKLEEEEEEEDRASGRENRTETVKNKANTSYIKQSMLKTKTLTSTE